MSRIDDLIAERCPNGIEFKPLGDVATFKRGTQLKAAERVPGPFPVVTAGRSESLHHNSWNYDKGSVTVTSHGAYAGHVNFWASPIWLANNVFLLAPNSDLLDRRYFYHFLKNNEAYLHAASQGGGVAYINLRDIQGLRVPVPPFEVQRELVGILDAFTELEAELETELEARRRQYGFFQGSLLSLSKKDARWMTLGDIGKVAMCKRVFKHETSPTGEIPFYKIGTFGGDPDAYISGELYELYRTQYPFPKKGDVLLSAAGTIGRAIPYDGEPAYFQDSNIVWIANDESVVKNSYLRYWYRVINWTTDGGTIQRLYNQNIQRARIAVPPLDEQERVVAILDKFDALVNDLSIGLPAELNARQRQYEHYRDRLFTFAEVA